MFCPPSRKDLAHRDHGLLLRLAVFLNAEHRLAEIVRVRHVVAVEDASRLVPSDSHGDGLIDPAANQIPGTGAPEIVEQPARTLRKFAGRGPALPKFLHRFPFAMEHERRDHGAGFGLDGALFLADYEAWLFEQLLNDPKAGERELHAFLKSIQIF